MPAESGIDVSDHVRKDLSLTGIFNILNKKGFLEGKDSSSATTVENIRFSDWGKQSAPTICYVAT